MSSQLEFYLKRKDREDIIEFIKDDLSRNCKIILDKELNFLAESIYNFVVLSYNNVDKSDITSYIIKKDKDFIDSLTEDDEKNLICVNQKLVEYIIFLRKKYHDILIERDSNYNFEE